MSAGIGDWGLGIGHSAAEGRATEAKVRAPLPLWERGWGEGTKSCGTRPPLPIRLRFAKALASGDHTGRGSAAGEATLAHLGLERDKAAEAFRSGFSLRLLAPASRCGFSLRLLAPALRLGFGSALLRAGARALPRGPWGAAGVRGSARRGGRRDAADVRDRPGTACPRTPTDSREPFAHGCAKGADEGWPFFGLPFFGHAKKGRSGSPKG